MKARKAYAVLQKKWCMLFAISGLKIFFLSLLLILFSYYCQGEEETQYDEFKIYLTIQGIGGARVSALIKDDDAYLSISEVFTLLKIKNNPSNRLDSLSGFFINQQDEYLIDKVNNRIYFQGRKIDLKPDDLILTETNLYMKTDLFGDVFGLKCVFTFRDFSVLLTTKLELPVIREMRMEQMRENLRRLKGEIKTDTTIGRSYPLFEFGMADWAITTSQQEKMNPYTRLSLALGSVVAGGEMNVGLNYDQANRFDSRQQSYLWRYANNDNRVLRQVSVGKMLPQTISTLNGALVGIQLTNTPTIFRRSFGTYTLSNVTEPGWTVELYVNNVLVDFVKADASGFYKFEVPLVYGNSVMMVRMYGPWGEVQTRIENANIPFNFLPTGELEYAVNAGVVEDRPGTKFTRTNLNYGVSRRMSIGGGYEYLSSPGIENSLPFIGSSVMLLNNLLISGEYTFGVRVKSSLSFRLPSNIQFDLRYAEYSKGQKAVLIAPIYERGISISAPLQGRHFSAYSRMSLSRLTYINNFQTTNLEYLISGNLFGISSNITTSVMYTDVKHINALSDLYFSFRLPHQFTIMPYAQYDYSQKRLYLVRCILEKPLLGKGYLNLSYEHNFIARMSSIGIGLRYDFSFMQTGLDSRFNRNSSTFTQTARGSLFLDRKNNHIGASNIGSVGRGAFTFIAFLDLNCNGLRDKNEPKVMGLNLRVNGGRIVRSDKDTTIRVIDLTPYTSYLVELDKQSFKSISWHIKKLSLSVYADPNQFKTIEIPIEVMSEASGTVSVKTKNGTKGQSRIYVCFYRENLTLINRTLTEEDGYFSYMGLQPGKYLVRLDSSQLRKNRLTSSPEFKWFTVATLKDGDFVEGLDFTLKSNMKDSVENILPIIESKVILSEVRAGKLINNTLQDSVNSKFVLSSNKNFQRYDSILPGVRYSKGVPTRSVKQELRNDSITSGVRNSKGIPNRKVTQELRIDSILPGEGYYHGVPKTGKFLSSKILILSRDSVIAAAKEHPYFIQIGAYIFVNSAYKAQQQIMAKTGRPIIIVKEDEFYKLWIDGFLNRREATLFVKRLTEMGYISYVKKVVPSKSHF